jgi:hypothetical protein
MTSGRTRWVISLGIIAVAGLVTLGWFRGRARKASEAPPAVASLVSPTMPKPTEAQAPPLLTQALRHEEAMAHVLEGAVANLEGTLGELQSQHDDLESGDTRAAVERKLKDLQEEIQAHEGKAIEIRRQLGLGTSLAGPLR